MKKNTIINSDCIEGMKQLPDKSIHCCVTSPPYYGLRDYGHDSQIGLEETPEAYVAKLVEVFREVKRVLRDDGTLWLNLGDSYAAQRGGTHQPAESLSGGISGKTIQGDNVNRDRFDGYNPTRNAHKIGLKHKDLIGIPWMVAFALRADGWYLRQDIIWHKPNPMPESVTDRCTKSHEYIFLLSKSQKYYYDQEAVNEPLQESSIKRNKTGWNGNQERGYTNGLQNNMSKYLGSDAAKSATTRNKRSVWTVTTKPFNGAHFATFPEDLIVDMIKAGCPEDGIVLDPFMGAGTTAVVARKLNRNYIGYELNPDYIRIAERRIYNKIGLFV